MVYIVKRYNQERKERLGDPKYNGDRKENCRIIDSNDRTCQKISDSKDRKYSNIRKGSKNRSGPVMRSYERSPVIVSFVTFMIRSVISRTGSKSGDWGIWNGSYGSGCGSKGVQPVTENEADRSSFVLGSDLFGSL